jgi:hypothetical protein
MAERIQADVATLWRAGLDECQQGTEVAELLFVEGLQGHKGGNGFGKRGFWLCFTIRGRMRLDVLRQPGSGDDTSCGSRL